MSGFMILLFYIAVLLALVNICMAMPLIDKICCLHGIDYGFKDIICLIVLTPMSCVYMGITLFSRVPARLVPFNWSYNSVGVAFLIQIGILIVTGLANKLVNKVYYKCNVKPYQRIKF